MILSPFLATMLFFFSFSKEKKKLIGEENLGGNSALIFVHMRLFEVLSDNEIVILIFFPWK